MSQAELTRPPVNYTVLFFAYQIRKNTTPSFSKPVSKQEDSPAVVDPSGGKTGWGLSSKVLGGGRWPVLYVFRRDRPLAIG
jgi:hypothetical protein